MAGASQKPSRASRRRKPGPRLRLASFGEPMSQTFRLLIVNDNALFRECLASVLGQHEVYRTIEVAAEPEEAIAKLKSLQPHIVLVDVSFANKGALELTERINSESPQVKVVILGLKDSKADIIKCVEAGASGYLLKEESVEDLRKVIDRVPQGKTVCSPEVAYTLFARLTQLAHKQRWVEQVESMKLTARELEILQLVSQGLSNKQIAENLFLSLHTVKNHIHSILDKLQVRRRLDAVAYARQRRWLKGGQF